MKTIRRGLFMLIFTGCLSLPGLAQLDLQQTATLAPLPGPPIETAKNLLEKMPQGPRCAYLITVADDFVVAAYLNGELIPEAKRQLLLDRPGATAEKINAAVKPGDWLVFHVVHNPIRQNAAKYFAVAGCLSADEFGFVSDPASPNWSVCDNPAKAPDFIRRRDVGAKARAMPIENPWAGGDSLMKEYAGNKFTGKAIWGAAQSTWIKFIALPAGLEKATPESGAIPRSEPANPDLIKRWPVQILSAIYGTGGKNADVTAKVKEYVETLHCAFSSNPVELGADPNPRWNKNLQIIYMKDGVRREQNRNENERVLPESFYGPQDAGELRAWLPELRWKGEPGEIQFHADGTFTSPGQGGVSRWEALEPKKLRLVYSDQRTLDFVFDYTWSSLSEAGNGKNTFHLVK